jgi:hypothetical protein
VIPVAPTISTLVWYSFVPRLPAQFHQRDSLARKGKGQFRDAASHILPPWRVGQLQLSGRFEPGVLLWRRVLWRSHRSPW